MTCILKRVIAMKSNSEKCLFVAGLVLLLVAVLSMVAENLLIADGCEEKCGPEKLECSSDDAGVVCSCSGNVDGVNWTNNTIRHSEAGDLAVSQDAVACSIITLCRSITLDDYECVNSSPAGDPPVYRCAPGEDGTECNKPYMIETGTQFKASCILMDCIEI